MGKVKRVAAREVTITLDCRKKLDPINPDHYDGDECMRAIEALGWGREFCLGSAMKYLWRAGRKGDAVEDLKKARWYLDRVISKAGL